jgi:hypothetical protein
MAYRFDPTTNANPARNRVAGLRICLTGILPGLLLSGWQFSHWKVPCIKIRSQN